MQVSPLYAELVRDSFGGWVRGYESDYLYLQDYIGAWLANDEGVEITGGDYGNFLLAVLIIIEEYIKRPSMLDYEPEDEPARERRVSVLISFERGTGCLDRCVYQQEVFRQLKGRS